MLSIHIDIRCLSLPRRTHMQSIQRAAYCTNSCLRYTAIWVCVLGGGAVGFSRATPNSPQWTETMATRVRSLVHSQENGEQYRRISARARARSTMRQRKYRALGIVRDDNQNRPLVVRPVCEHATHNNKNNSNGSSNGIEKLSTCVHK